MLPLRRLNRTPRENPPKKRAPHRGPPPSDRLEVLVMPQYRLRILITETSTLHFKLQLRRPFLILVGFETSWLFSALACS